MKVIKENYDVIKKKDKEKERNEKRMIEWIEKVKKK